MTGSRGNRARLAALLVMACAGAGVLAWAAAQPAVAAAPACSISGHIEGNNPAHVGDPIYAVADVTGRHCSAVSIEFRGGGRVLDDQFVVPGQTSYSTIFNAFSGLSTVTAVLNTGQTAILGAVNVTGASSVPPPPRTTTVVPAPRTTTRTAAPSAGASGTRTTRATKSPTKSPTRAIPQIRIPDYGGADDEETDSETPTPSAPSASSSDSAVAFPVDVIKGSGSVNPIPSGLLVATIVILGGVLGAAIRFVYVYTRSPDHAA